jgi:hypothetical protein
MAAGSTYTPIATTTLTSNAASIAFTSIPGTYTDLVLQIQVAETTNGFYYIRYNNDSSAIYSRTFLSGNGTAASSGRSTAQTGISSGGNPAFPSASITTLNFMNYANTTTFKTALSRYNRADSSTDALVWLWRSTAAVTSIYIVSPYGGSDLETGTNATLYGIASA